MDKETLKEYREKWKVKIKLLLEHSGSLDDTELRYITGFDKYLNNYDELSRKQSKTLNDIYERFVNNNG